MLFSAPGEKRMSCKNRKQPGNTGRNRWEERWTTQSFGTVTPSTGCARMGRNNFASYFFAKPIAVPSKINVDGNSPHTTQRLHWNLEGRNSWDEDEHIWYMKYIIWFLLCVSLWECCLFLLGCRQCNTAHYKCSLNGIFHIIMKDIVIDLPIIWIIIVVIYEL